jgi:hypothetical protein
MINLKKRLILDADINFDSAGEGEIVTFSDSDGKSYSARKINASHIPLTKNTRQKIAAKNVDDALFLMAEKLDNSVAGDILEEDVEIEFKATDDVETIQNKINQQKKNLNGHTLTFVFPASLPQMLYSSLVWKDFYNGTVVVMGGTEGSKITIYDQLDINSLFLFKRCQCEVIVKNFHFVHQYSLYGIIAESSSAVIVEQCMFTGMENVDTWAVYEIAGSAILVDCGYLYDLPLHSMVMDEILAYERKLDELDKNKANLSLENVNDNIDFVIESATETLEDGGFMWYEIYRSGKIIQGGLSMGGAVGKTTLTMLKAMPDTNYSIFITPAGISTDNLGVSGLAYITPSNITVAGFDLYGAATAGSQNKYWRAEWRKVEQKEESEE